ncbi:cytochrome C biogenesis protein [Corynebacterium atypicum]|uniref:Cytochrome C biogenesis protein n=1 Tax=Corynebacterium atypicum TaxID=191610 RepID=A0ABM5QLI2_9CORY|nr:c-type cytochrome biogenesis protein CcsB [Corynebacterium atypicum]AIG63605.1 cytochrome C biogenesis protein [Corynebacterium atypicum]
MSTLSDRAFQAAFLAFLVALVLSLFYYVKAQAIVAAGRRTPAADWELVAAGTASHDAQDRDLPVAGGPGSAHAASESGKKTLAQQQESARKWGGATQSVIWLGIIFQVAATVTRGLAVGRFPLGNMYEYMLMITAVTMIVAAVVVQIKGSKIVWPWILTPLLVLMFFAGTKLYAEAAPVVPALQSYWLPIHVTSVSVGASIGMVSGIFSVLYLLRVRQPVGREHGLLAPVIRPLPSAQRLDRIAYRLAVFTLPLLGIGIILGAIWAEAAWGRFWGWDPKETFSFITWILYAAYLHARATAGWKVGAAWINVVALCTMVFNLFFINLVVSGLHSYAGLN